MAAAGEINTDFIKGITTGPNGIIAVVNDYLVPLIFTIALLVFLFGIAKAYILTSSETERAKGHQLILWGIIGFAVMLSIWGLVNLVIGVFGLDSATAPKPPTI
jgi:uncharacterized membrane protein